MHRSSLLAAAAAVTALAVPTAANAVPGQSGWLIYVKGSQTISWDEPRHPTSSDCFHRSWVEDHGRETVTFHAKEPTKAVLTAYGSVVAFSQFGSLELGNGTPQAGVPISVAVNRDNDSQSGSDPGDCGGGSTVDPAPLQDCGSRVDAWIGSPVFQGGKVELQVGPDLAPLTGGGDTGGFSSCPAQAPEGVSTGTLTDGITAKLSARKLASATKGDRIVVDGHKAFQQVRKLPGGGSVNLRADVNWQLRMLRVR
jgi:hypothetical protein